MEAFATKATLCFLNKHFHIDSINDLLLANFLSALCLWGVCHIIECDTIRSRRWYHCVLHLLLKRTKAKQDERTCPKSARSETQIR